MEEIRFVCPQCNSSLIQKDNTLVCSGCNAAWQIVDGVVKLSRSPSYWSILPVEDMKGFLQDVKIKGWKDAIVSSKNPRIKDLYLFTDCPSRADGTFYLSLTSESRVLDLGPGWGSYTFALSPRVESVVAADSSLESLEFISLRAKQDGIENIAPVHIEPLDQGKLPFEERSFDVVVMNGVLEWVGSYLKGGDPLKIQQKCLKEVGRVLKETGELWIGIENRFGLKYLQGEPDDHLRYYSSKKSVSYTTVVPRIIANMMTQKALGIPYRTYTHSLWGLKRLLKKAGFKEIEFYYPLEGYRAVSAKIYPIQSQEVRSKIRERIRPFSLFGLEPALCNNFFVLARK